MITTAIANLGIITISGYFDGGTIEITEKSVTASLASESSIDEQELSSVVQILKDTLNAQGKSHTELCQLVGSGVDLDFSTKLDIEEIQADLDRDEEAKINVSGESSAHINKLVSEIRVNVKNVDEIYIDKHESNKGYISTYIRIY